MQQNTSTQEALTTKKHFKILDGLRGLAAIAVVVFHFMEFVEPDYNDNFIAHSYLAVDFFFCLSGFVIAYAYDSRIATIGFTKFIKLRLIRLHPLVMIGAIIGLIAFVVDPFSDLFAQYGSTETLLMFLSSALMIPYAVVDERYFNIFHLNPPTWSLFWEYIANIAYALFLFRLRKNFLWIATLVAAVVLFYASHDAGYLAIGWGGENFWGGAARILFSFLAGMLIYRTRFIIPNRIGFFGLSLLLLAAFVFPFIEEYNWLIDPLLVVVYFPLIVALGAGSTLSKSLEKVCDLSGGISYPLYMIHYPFLWLYLSMLEKNVIPEKYINASVWIGVLDLVVLSYIVMRFIDEPIRKKLKTRMKQKAARKEAAVIS